MQSLVPSLETCKKLKELGWEKETYFYWYNSTLTGWNLSPAHIDHVQYPERLYAPTADEIDLPWSLQNKNSIRSEDEYYLEIDAFEGEYSADYYQLEYYLFHTEYYPSLAEAMAQVWIKLKEEGYLK